MWGAALTERPPGVTELLFTHSCPEDVLWIDGLALQSFHQDNFMEFSRPWSLKKTSQYKKKKKKKNLASCEIIVSVTGITCFETH